MTMSYVGLGTVSYFQFSVFPTYYSQMFLNAGYFMLPILGCIQSTIPGGARLQFS
jgi:hypothetical protein